MDFSIYNIFSSFTHRGAVLVSIFKRDSNVPKFLSKTRYKVHSMNKSSIFDSYDGIISALHQLHIDTTKEDETRNQDINLFNKMEEFEFMVICICGVSYLLDEFHNFIILLNHCKNPSINQTICRTSYDSFLGIF